MSRISSSGVDELLSLSAPSNPDPEIFRYNLLATPMRFFDSGVQLILVEGEEGIGKTTFLTQFARTYSASVIATFVRPLNRLTTNTASLKFDLAHQIQSKLRGHQGDSSDIADIDYPRLLFQLKRRAKQRGEAYYFVIDGIHDLPEEDDDVREAVFQDLLDFGSVDFKFLVSCTQEMVPRRIREAIRYRTFLLPAFSLQDTREYFHDLDLDEEDTQRLYVLAGRGKPSSLASIRRELAAGSSVERLVDHDALDFVELEWRRVNISEAWHRTILAVMAFGRSEFTAVELASISGVNSDAAAEFLESAAFIDCDGPIPLFASGAHRNYARQELIGEKDQATSKVVEFLTVSGDDIRAIRSLPNYYKQLGQHEEIVQHIDTQGLLNVLSSSKSLHVVHRHNLLGMEAANAIGNFEATLGYGMQQAVLNDLNQADYWSSEVEARIALGDFESAVSAATAVPLLEDKLFLLSAIVREMLEQGLEIAPEIKEQVQVLASQVSPSTLGPRAVEVATNLVGLDTDLAIQFIEATSTANEEEGLDWAFGQLALSAMRNDPVPSSEEGSAVDQVRSRIRDPQIREFYTAISMLTKEFSADKVVARANELQPKNRLFFLRRWVAANPRGESAERVVEAALELWVGSSTKYVPKTRDLRELALALPHIRDESEIERLVRRFDSLIPSLSDLGTTTDYARLQLSLAEAESRLSMPKARDRVLELFWRIADIGDLPLRTDCLAYFVARLKEIDKSGFIETTEGLASVAAESLSENTTSLLADTALQFSLMKGVVVALAKAEPEASLELCGRLNTASRRDRATEVFLREHLSSQNTSPRLDLVLRAVLSVKDFATLARCIRMALKYCADNVGIVSDQQSSLGDLVVAGKDLPQAIDRARCLALGIAIMCQLDNPEPEVVDLMATLEDAWDSIDVGWFKADCGFWIARELADAKRSLASEYFAKAEEFRNATALASEDVATTVIASLLLVSRALSGLLPRSLESDADIEAFSDYVDMLPSLCERVGVWSDFALRAHRAGRGDLLQNVVATKVQALLDNMPTGDTYARYVAYIAAAPALYVHHPATALKRISSLPKYEREKALYRICQYLLHKLPPKDPLKDAGQFPVDVTYEAATDLCDVLSHAETEALLADVIGSLARGISQRFVGSEQQASEIRNRLSVMVEEKLPDVDNIRHDGYVVLLKAHILSSEKGSKGPHWNELIRDAENIPNASDRAYVLAWVGALMPSRLDKLRSQVMDTALDSTRAVPSLVDRAERLLTLASEIKAFDRAAAKNHTREAFRVLVDLEDAPEGYSLRNRAIDLAHALDPDFASQLISTLDDDPARLHLKHQADKQVKTLTVRDKLINSEPVGSADTDSLASAAWMALASLNANRMQTLHFDVVMGHLDPATSGGLWQVYPVFAWVIENTVRRHALNPDRKAHLVEVFRSTLRSAALTLGAASLRRSEGSALKPVRSTEPTPERRVFGPGERDEAFDYLETWIKDFVDEYLIICDPYFGPADVEVLAVVRRVAPQVQVHVLTSQKHVQNRVREGALDEAFLIEWRRFSDQDPPPARIVVAGYRDNDVLPVHDRWWLSRNAGLAIGTSLNSLGRGKYSEVSILDPVEALRIEREVVQPFLQQRLDLGGRRMKYASFTL